MARESWGALRLMRAGLPPPARKRRHHAMVANLPLRWRFYRSGLYISPFAPLLLGVGVGVLTMLLGVGGGFIMVPAMVYLLGMGSQVVVGTSLFQILFRSEEHTSELQSLMRISYALFCLKKKNRQTFTTAKHLV